MRDRWFCLIDNGRGKWVVGLIVLLALAALMVAVAFRRGDGPASGTRSQTMAAIPSTVSDPITGPPRTARVPNQGGVGSQGEANDLREAAAVRPAYSSHHQGIMGQTAHHPDLYAAAFTRELLTQDYRTPRGELLAWVQAESAQTDEPQVIGLVPAQLRNKWAVYSVTQDQGTPPIPSPRRWGVLASSGGHTAVRIESITEPVAWSTAVLAGDITDPGITAREVDAVVSLHTTVHGKARSKQFSVALTMNLEGPPTRSAWGFVTAVTYDVVPMGPAR